jgi:hypothetical protein
MGSCMLEGRLPNTRKRLLSDGAPALSCNAWNHPPGCDCGWGGASYGFSSPALVAPRLVSFTNPNAHCPVCGAEVYFFRSENGGSVYFDDLGWPWPKHPCTDSARDPGNRRTSATSPSAPARVTSDEGKEDDWIAFEILTFRREAGMTLVVGRIDDQTPLVHLGVLQDIQTGRRIPSYLRAKPERRGVVDLTTLSKLDPVVVDAYLDCSELDDLNAWRAALVGSPLHQNSIGWRMSFGRDRTYAEPSNQFTRPNWLGGGFWLCEAAAQGHPSALNNLASGKMLAACGITEQEQEGLRQRLYACATALGKSRSMPEGTDRQNDLEEAARLVSFLSANFTPG